MTNDEFDLDIQLTEEQEEDRSQQGVDPTTTVLSHTCFATCDGGTCTTCVRVPC